MISAAEPQPKPGHKLLKGIIRGTMDLLGILLILISIGFVFFVTVMVFKAWHATATGRWLLWFGCVPVLALFLALILSGYRMCRQIIAATVDAVTVANFAFVFSYLLARLFYLVLPQDIPGFVSDHFRHSPFATDHELGNGGFRTLLSVAAFFIFYALIKANLLQIFELDRVNHPQNSGPSETDIDVSDPTVPEFPRKSPLVPLE